MDLDKRAHRQGVDYRPADSQPMRTTYLLSYLPACEARLAVSPSIPPNRCHVLLVRQQMPAGGPCSLLLRSCAHLLR